MKNNNTALGVMAALTGGVFWGISGVFGSYIFENYGVNAGWLVNVRLIIAGTIMVVLVGAKEKKKVFDILKDFKMYPLLLFFAVFGMGLCQYSYYTAVELSNAGTATVIQYTAPVVILLYFCMIERTLPEIVQIISLVFAMSGVVLLATGGKITSLAVSQDALFWALVSALAMAVFNIAPVKLMYKYGTACVVGWGMIIAGILMSFWIKPWNFSELWSWDFKATGAMAVVIILGTVLSFTFYMEGVKLAGAETASLVASVEPLTATVATVIMMGTSFSYVELVGILLIIAAVLILSMKNRLSTGKISKRKSVKNKKNISENSM